MLDERHDSHPCRYKSPTFLIYYAGRVVRPAHKKMHVLPKRAELVMMGYFKTLGYQNRLCRLIRKWTCIGIREPKSFAAVQ